MWKIILLLIVQMYNIFRLLIGVPDYSSEVIEKNMVLQRLFTYVFSYSVHRHKTVVFENWGNEGTRRQEALISDMPQGTSQLHAASAVPVCSNVVRGTVLMTCKERYRPLQHEIYRSWWPFLTNTSIPDIDYCTLEPITIYNYRKTQESLQHPLPAAQDRIATYYSMSKCCPGRSMLIEYAIHPSLYDMLAPPSF